MTTHQPHQPTAEFAPIDLALADIAAGRPLVVVDDEDRENEGDLIFAAEKATADLVTLMIRECGGLICVPMTGADLDRLALDQMVNQNTERMGTAFTVSVDARAGVSTGISAADRAATISLLADPASTAQDIVRPGHVFPLRARPGGVLRRAGHTEAAVDLATLAGLRPAGAICEIMNADGTTAGYDLEMTAAISDAVKIPVVASGGAGSPQHLLDVLTTGHADAALAASIFHFGTFSIPEVKRFLAEHGVPVRII